MSLAGLVLLFSTLQGWFSYSAARQIIEQDAIQAVGLSAEARRQALLYELRHCHERVGFLLERLRGPCLDGDRAVCERMLQSFVASEEEVTGVHLSARRFGRVAAGEWQDVGDAEPVAGQLADFRRDWRRGPHYRVWASSEQGDTLTVRFRMAKIDSIFLDRQGLGESGESFLTDGSARFLTPPRYAPGVGLQSHPIEARPMEMCLSGEDTEILDKDYRGADIVHGFRYVPEIGGGCIMVHLDRAEAFARAGKLGEKLFLGVGVFGFLGIGVAVLLARALTKPILLLSQTASRVTEGDLDARAPVMTADEVGGLARTFNAMLERIAERTAELAASNEELEAFSYSVSHDLRAPLRAIHGFSDALIEDYSDTRDPEFTRLLDVIRRNARRMGQLIDDLLAVSRLARREMTFVPVDMTELATAAFDELRPATKDRDIGLTIKDLPRAYGDPRMLRQVFANLLSNAIKFTEGKDPAVIEIGHAIIEDESVYYVTDNGVGFDMRYSDRLFRVFQRLHPADEFEGTGVGLAIVQRIVQRHGGRVWAESAIDEGATIRFSLPGSTSEAGDRTSGSGSSDASMRKEISRER